MFTPTIIDTYTAGATSTQRFVLEGIDGVALDQKLRAIWNGMNNALIAGDKDKAMSYLNGGAQAKYGPVFDVLLPSMPGIVGSYSTLAKGSLSENIGEYAVRRTVNGSNRLYLIYLLRDLEGIWRIDSM